jgi:hypothetical protein
MKFSEESELTLKTCLLDLWTAPIVEIDLQQISSIIRDKSKLARSLVGPVRIHH